MSLALDASWRPLPFLSWFRQLAILIHVCSPPFACSVCHYTFSHVARSSSCSSLVEPCPNSSWTPVTTLQDCDQAATSLNASETYLFSSSFPAGCMYLQSPCCTYVSYTDSDKFNESASLPFNITTVDQMCVCPSYECGLLPCPPGSSGPDGGPCSLCPIGKYKTTSGSGQCMDCNPGLSTHETGATADIFCVIVSPEWITEWNSTIFVRKFCSLDIYCLTNGRVKIVKSC